MKLKSLLFLGLAASTLTTTNAQTWVTDSVEMGSTVGKSYPVDIYYSFKNGTAKRDTNTKWHLAFGMIPQFGPSAKAPIIANHVQADVMVYSLNKTAASFGALTFPADTQNKVALINSDTSWNYGAMNMNADASNPFDYGWGKYSMTSHFVEGDSLYMVKANGVAYQVLVQQYKSTPMDSIQYIVRIANIDGTNDRTLRIYRKNGFTDRNFAYLNLATDAITDREPARAAWDVLFTRYRETVTQGSITASYPVMTVLSNYNVYASEVVALNPDTTGFMAKTYGSAINIIGSDWKTPPPPSWVVRDSCNYFIKTKNTNEYYQLHFLQFSGSSGNPSFLPGKIIFEKRKLGDVLSVTNVNTAVTAYTIAPNPAVNETNIMLDAKQADANTVIFVTDLSGKVVERHNVKLNAGVNAYRINTAAYNNGIYMITIASGEFKATQKLVVQH